jgi:hypothetical protein
MAAGGMGRAGDRLRAPLSQRGHAPSEPTEAPPLAQPGDGRPCWVHLGEARVEGVVHGWHRDEATGRWLALVVAWLPAVAVAPRDGPP